MAGFVKHRNFPLVLIASFLCAWLAWHCNDALNSSHAWLMIAATRLLAGGHMATDFFDPDPPMSVIAYLPPAMLSQWLGLPLYYAPYVWGLICLALSTGAVRAILAAWPEPDADGRTVLLFAYVIANTLLTASVYFYFGERDHIVALGLYPFLLIQLSMTWHYAVPQRLAWPVLAFGAILILIKPQYGLLPCLLLAHRMVAHRRLLSIIKDADFIALACAVIACLLVLLIVFPDYLANIFPGFLQFYLTQHNPQTPHIWFIYVSLLICLLLLTAMLGLPLERLRLPLLSFLAAFICFGLFLLQMKGIYYQLIPALVFLMTGTGMLLQEAMSYHCTWRPGQRALAIALLCVMASALSGKGVTTLRHRAYAQTPLAQLVAGCAPSCSYLIFSEDIEKVSQIEIYTGAPYASRFPVLWWLPGLIKALGAHPDNAQLLAYRAAYTHAVGEDLARFHPDVIAVATTLTVAGRKNFDIVGFLSGDTLFQTEMKNYGRSGVLNDNRNNYFRLPSRQNDVPIAYDIYRRR